MSRGFVISNFSHPGNCCWPEPQVAWVAGSQAAKASPAWAGPVDWDQYHLLVSPLHAPAQNNDDVLMSETYRKTLQ